MALPKTSDASCWSPSADRRGVFAPVCARCSNAAIGGILEKYSDEVYRVRFECGDHENAADTFVMTVANMNRRWNPISKLGEGLYNVVEIKDRGQIVRDRKTTEIGI